MLKMNQIWNLVNTKVLVHVNTFYKMNQTWNFTKVLVSALIVSICPWAEFTKVIPFSFL